MTENGTCHVNAPVNGKVWIWREGTTLRYGTGPDFARDSTSGLMRTVSNATGSLHFDSSFKSTTSAARARLEGRGGGTVTGAIEAGTTLSAGTGGATRIAKTSWGYREYTIHQLNLIGQVTIAENQNTTQVFEYHALGRLTADHDWGTGVYSSYDAAGRRTRGRHRDGFTVDYDYNFTGKVTRIRENGATSGIGVLATFGYDDLAGAPRSAAATAPRRAMPTTRPRASRS